MLVGGIVVNHQMNVEIRRNFRLDVLEKPKEFLVPVTRTALGENLAIRDIEGSKQGRSAMPDIIVRDAFEIAKAKRQHRLRTLQCLDLRFLIDTQNNYVIWRIEIKADDILSPCQQRVDQSRA